MIPFEEAISAVLSQARPLETKDVPLSEALGHALAQDALATLDMPNFSNSAMDGFGVRIREVKGASSDTPAKLKLSGTIQAGDSVAGKELSPGTAVKILTGAPVPAGTEAVVMKEYAQEQNGYVLLSRSARDGENIRFQGEEYALGDPVLRRGTNLTPPAVGLLANFGYASVTVHRKPKVTVLVTGNELVPVGEDLQPGQIYESNSHALAAALKDMGITNCLIRHAADHQESLQEAMEQALRESDMMLSAGGISVGDYDLVKEVLTDLGVETVFWRVAMKPGRPNFFGTRTMPSGDSLVSPRLVFGLPGNPVSALVSFQLLVRPALLTMMGSRGVEPLSLKASLSGDFKKKTPRAEFVRGVVSYENDQLVVSPTRGQGSHMLGGLSQANCLICFPTDAGFIAQGQQVPIQLLDWL